MVDAWNYIVGLELAPSDWALFATILPITWFIIVYGIFTRWFEDPFGWIILSGALSLWGVIFIVIYAVFAGQRIDETIRFILFMGILISWVGKTIILHRTRRDGRVEKRQRHDRPTLGPTPTKETS